VTSSASCRDLTLTHGRLWSGGDRPILTLASENSTRDLAPTTHCLFEWSDYWLQSPAADHLRLGNTRLAPIADGLFRLRFENRLGLVTIRSFDGATPVGSPLHVEIISPKFPTPASHLGFFRVLLDDLFLRAARLPFALPIADPATSRGVLPANRPPTPLFTFHFLLQHGPAIAAALAIIEAAPHRRLHDRIERIPPALAADIDGDTILAILHAPNEWVRVPTRGAPLVDRLCGHAPTRVRQRLPEETFDTPENRFVLAAFAEFLRAAETLPSQTWWLAVPKHRRAAIRDTSARLRRAVALPLFAEVGPMQRFPSASRVLLGREGYRDLLALWQLFQQARRPLFAPLRQAIDLRDIAHLYELWAFFALTEEIAVALAETPVIYPQTTDAAGLDRGAVAHFGTAGRLIYNLSTRAYSGLHLRPDFTWRPAHGPALAFDAKFRLTRRDLEPEAASLPEATPTHDDLAKMHAYRDALGVRAAVALYPGDLAVFHDHRSGRETATIRSLVLDNPSGVGAIPLRPDDSVNAEG